MICALCQSGRQEELPAEVLLHFSGIAKIDNPGVLMFPKISVCLNCGFSWFVTPEAQLAQVAFQWSSDDLKLQSEQLDNRR